MKSVRRLVLASAFTFIAAALVGCEDPADDMSKVVLEQQAKQAAVEKQLPKIPTTQELVSGPRTTVALGPLPLTMRVPTSWKVDVKGGATLLEGFTPSGSEIAIQLSSRSSLKKEELDALIRGAKREQQEKPQSILKVEIRPWANGYQIYEWQAVGEPQPYTLYDKQGKEHTTMEQLFKWTITVLAPHAEAFQRYDLNFVGLTKNQYDQDKDFLRGLLDTLAPAAAGATGGSTAGTAATLPAAVGASPPPTTSP